MGKRAFLQWIGSGIAGIGAAKSGLFSLLKGGGKKQVIKELTSVPINNIEGMPVWFKPLVNKVIAQGDDVTKKYATLDRQIVHQSTLPNSKTPVTVTQDLSTGDVSVDIGMGKHGFKDGLHGQPVRLEYKAAEDIMSGPDMDAIHKVGVRDPHIKVKRRDEMTFDQKKHPNKAPEEFWVEEAEFTGGHPENVKFEDVSYEKFGQHGSNFDEVEKFATGKVKKAKTTETKFLGKKYLHEGDDMADGGRVPMLFGGGIFKTIIKNLAKARGVNPSEYLKITNYKALPSDVKKYLTKADFEKMKASRVEMFENWVDMARTRKEFQESVKAGKEGSPHAAPIFENLEQSFKSPVPSGVTDKDILQGEFILKNLKTKDRKLHSTGGRIGFSAGKGIMTIIKNLLKKKPKKLETVKDFIEKRNFLKGMIGNSEKNRNKRILDKILEENKKVKGFEFENIDIDKEIRPIFDQSKDRKLHSTGGLAAMLGE